MVDIGWLIAWHFQLAVQAVREARGGEGGRRRSEGSWNHRGCRKIFSQNRQGYKTAQRRVPETPQTHGRSLRSRMWFLQPTLGVSESLISCCVGTFRSRGTVCRTCSWWQGRFCFMYDHSNTTDRCRCMLLARKIWILSPLTRPFYSAT